VILSIRRWIARAVAALAAVLLACLLWPRGADAPLVKAVRTAPVVAAASSAAASEPTPRARLAAAQAQAQLHGARGDECALPLAAIFPAASGVDADAPAAREAVERSAAFAAFKASVLRIDAALRSSPDPYANALAIWLNVPRDDAEERGVPEPERRRELAAMAVSTTDPRIYAMAFHACRQSADDGCHALTARRWAELDPGNAMPWLYLRNEASERGDVSGQEEAWFHIAASARMDEGAFMPVPAIVAASQGSPGGTMAAYALSEVAIGIAAAQFVPVVTFECRKRAPMDANRMQQCVRIADLMFEHSDAPMDRMSGAVLTWRLTGDASRKQVAGAELQSWAERFKLPPLTCDEMRQQTSLLESVDTRGLLATLASGASAPSQDVHR
jgi:hypothetical protein